MGGYYKGEGKERRRFFSYGITLPPKWVEDNKLDEGARVTVITLKDKLIIVSAAREKEIERIVEEAATNTLKLD